MTTPELILNVLEDYTSLDVRQLATETKRSQSSVRRAAQQLVTEGKLIRGKRAGCCGPDIYEYMLPRRLPEWGRS